MSTFLRNIKIRNFWTLRIVVGLSQFRLPLDEVNIGKVYWKATAARLAPENVGGKLLISWTIQSLGVQRWICPSFQFGTANGLLKERIRHGNQGIPGPSANQRRWVWDLQWLWSCHWTWADRWGIWATGLYCSVWDLRTNSWFLEKWPAQAHEDVRVTFIGVVLAETWTQHSARENAGAWCPVPSC